MKSTVKYGGSMIVSGCMSWKGIGNLHLIEGILDKHLYQQILEKGLLDTIKWQSLMKESSSSSMITTWNMHPTMLRSGYMKEFNVLDLPLQSPDMNLISYLWNELDRCLHMCENKPPNKTDLWEEFSSIWSNIELDFVGKLITFVPQWISDIVESKSGYIHS